MASKRIDAYISLLEAYKEAVLAEQIQVASIMTDYDVALRPAMSHSFPEARLRCCWFHYGRAAYMKCVYTPTCVIMLTNTFYVFF